jgi:hypothetical protein
MMAIWGGVPNNQTVTNTSGPASYVQPYINQALQGAQGIYNQGPQQYYGGPTVVPFSNETNSALDAITSRAQAGSPINGAASNYATGVLNNPVTSQFGAATNPHLDAMFQQAANPVINNIQSNFAGAGRNIGAGKPVAEIDLSHLATGIYGGAYEGERNRMLSDLSNQRGIQASVLGMAPDVHNLGYADQDRLLGVGGLREDLTGRQYEDQAARFDFSQNAPGVALDQYLARIQGAPGSTSSSTSPIYRNQGAGALGGALAGYQLGDQLGGYGGWGALAGGLLGYGG